MMSSTPSHILCIGAAHWDVIGRADTAVQPGDDVPGRIERRPGGVALNVATGLAGLGCTVSLCSAVGQDDSGDALLRRAMTCGIDCRHVLQVSGVATEAYVAIEDSAGNLVAAVADSALLELHAEDVLRHAEVAAKSASVIFLEANLPMAAIGRIAETAHQLDVEVVANPVSPAKAVRLAGLLSGPGRRMIIANISEANVLTEATHDSARDAAMALHRRGAHTALVTNGANAAALATSDGTVVSTPPHLQSGASATGAGDAFLAGYLASPDRHSDLQAALDRSLLCAANHMKRPT